MKKILMVVFASVAMLASVSCSKDDENKSSASLVGTLWVANVEYSDVPILGSGSVEAELYFRTESVCRFDADLPAMVQMALSTMGINNLEAGDYNYTFDGNKVTVSAMSGVELDYNGNTLVYHIPSQYNMIATYIGGSEVVFYKQ